MSVLFSPSLLAYVLLDALLRRVREFAVALWAAPGFDRDAAVSEDVATLVAALLDVFVYKLCALLFLVVRERNLQLVVLWLVSFE